MDDPFLMRIGPVLVNRREMKEGGKENGFMPMKGGVQVRVREIRVKKVDRES